MKNKVDFKKVANVARFGILGSYKMMTPKEFSALPEVEKLEVYQAVFNLHHDCCSFLSANINLDELYDHYSED